MADGRAIVFFDADGGLVEALEGQPASFARQHFGFLQHEWRFGLHRDPEACGLSGSLHMDERGEQRMEMVGIRSNHRNKHRPPDRKWTGELRRDLWTCEDM